MILEELSCLLSRYLPERTSILCKPLLNIVVLESTEILSDSCASTLEAWLGYWLSRHIILNTLFNKEAFFFSISFYVSVLIGPEMGSFEIVSLTELSLEAISKFYGLNKFFL